MNLNQIPIQEHVMSQRSMIFNGFSVFIHHSGSVVYHKRSSTVPMAIASQELLNFMQLGVLVPTEDFENTCQAEGAGGFLDLGVLGYLHFRKHPSIDFVVKD